MGKKVQIVQRDLGNTETKSQPKKAQQIATKRYCFTKNDIPQNEEEAKVFYSSYSAKLKEVKNIIFHIFSLELGENKTFHLQGYIELEIKARITELKKFESGAHFEPCKGNRDDNISYCSKNDETHIIGPTIYDKSKEPKYTPQQLRILPEDKLYRWQKKALEIARGEIDDRDIYWFWSKETGTGKTQVNKHLMYYDSFDFVDGDKGNIMCAIVGDDGKKEIKKGYVFNFSNDKDLNKVSYTAMENMKDGLIFSGKYKSGGMLIPPLQVIVMANGPPACKLTNRWKVYEIKKSDIDYKLKKEIEIIVDF